MKEYKEVLKNTPEYEKYCENEAVLTAEEIRELGLLKQSSCSKSNGGCSKGKCCCKK